MSSKIGRRRKDAARGASPVYMDRRHMLMEAAAEAFREYGLEGASLNDIARRSGLDRASLYYYVESKEELYRSIVEDVVHRNVEQIEAVQKGPGTGAEKLAEAIRLLMKSFEENYPHLYIFLAEDFGRRGPQRRTGGKGTEQEDSKAWFAELWELGDRYHVAFRDIVAQGFADGSLESMLSPGIVAHGLVGMVSWSHRWFVPGGGATAEEIAEGFVDMILRGLSPSARR